MNNFIEDNFQIGDSIKIYCNGHYIEGILVSLDDFYLEIKDNFDVIHQIQGSVTQNFREISSKDIIPDNLSKGENNEHNSTKNSILHETDTEKRMKSGLKILGKMTIKNEPQKKWNSEKVKKGYLPYDGVIKTIKDKWDYCFVTNNKNKAIEAHLKLKDFYDAEELYEQNKLENGLPIHYYLYQDNHGYHAHVAFHSMTVEKFLSAFRKTDIEREREESETYVMDKLDSFIKSGDPEAAFSLIYRIVSDKDSDESFNRELVAKQIAYAYSVKDNSIAISAYTLLLSSTPKMSKKEKSSIYYEITKLQMADDMDREVLEMSIGHALENDPQNMEAKELKKLIAQMPRKEKHNDSDLLLDDDDDELLLPSLLISKDTDFIDAFGELISDPSKVSDYQLKAKEYAIRRGNSLYEQFKNNIRHAPADKLNMLADSAISYYMETLRISQLTDKELLDILTKSLVLNSARYFHSRGEETISEKKFDKIIYEALSSSDEEYKGVILKFLISIGAKSGVIWNRLLKMDSGTKGLYNLAFTEEMRRQTYEIVDTVEGNLVESADPLPPFDYLRNTIEEVQRKKQALRDIQSSITLDVMAMDEVAEIISQIEPLAYVLPPSDITLYNSLLEICDGLYSYKTALTQQRLDILHESRRKLDDCMNRATTYPTFFGRSFFYPIFTRWRTVLSSNIESRTALLYPKFQIIADPPFITHSDRGTGVGIIIQNIGQSESFGYQMTCTFTSESPNDKPIINTFEATDQIAPSGKISQFIIIPDNFNGQESIKLEIDISAKSHGKILKAGHFAWTLTEEINANELMNTDSIKWSINKKAKEDMFKGRERDLMELWEHYTTVSEMDRPVILYGLTRMGKSSILIALAEKIKGTSIEIDGQELIIMPFFWELNDIAKQDTEFGVWDSLLYQRLYVPLLKYSKEIGNYVQKRNGYEIEKCPPTLKAQHFEWMLSVIRKAGIYPMIFVDEYSYMRDLIAGINKSWNLGVGFAQTLRDYSFNRFASFIYAGTYDVRDLVKDEKYGCLGGAYTGYIQRHVSGIDREPAEELMRVMEPDVQFTGEALDFLHILSGDVPFFVQMICMNCAKFAIANHRRIIGFPELEYVTDILTSHQKPTKKNYIVTPLSDTDFMGNLLDPTNTYEEAFYSCMVKLAIVRNNVADNVSQSDIFSVWKLNHLSDSEQELKNARDSLLEKQILEKIVDEDEVYFKIKVDLFRRWWSKYKEEDINIIRRN